MSISVTKIVNLPQAALKFLVQDEIEDEPTHDYKTLGGVFSDSDYAWLSSGPRLEIVHTKTGSKVGAWTFGWVLKDSNTEVFCVEEIQRPNGRLPLIAVGVDCDLSGGMICIFDFIRSKIIRAIQIRDKITSLHVIDAGYDVFTLPGPLRNFDGIIAVGTAGGEVFLVDICRQICDEALTAAGLNEIRDELNPCTLFNITLRDLGRIEHHKEFAIRNSHHIAIHLNVVFDKSTKHFTLKGPKGDDRLHVNKDEVAVSSLCYCPQLGSLLVGYNFGALQLYNLMNLELVYTSPVCDEHIPISHFALQEPADDPRAVCYIWAIYSSDEEYPSCLPLAVMYSFCYQTKEYHEGYGCLYQNFSSASVHFQMELAIPHGYNKRIKPRGGNCLKIKSINQGCVNREGLLHESNDEILTFCVLVWNVWYSNKEIDTFLAIFDLNQWYKEQMPNVPNSEYYYTYMIQLYLNDIIRSATEKNYPILDVLVNKNSIQQFTGPQRLEEHFYPNSITFGMTCLSESDVVSLQNYGVQKALLAQIESSGPLSLVEPADIYQEVISLGLVPLFIDLPVNTPISTNQQREIILGAALENHLVGWLCKCASEWANGSFLSAGCSLDLLINWAFQRAITLKTNCDKFCTCLFDYSEIRLDNNTTILLNSCTRQLKIICSLYDFIVKKLTPYVSNQELVEDQFKSLETICVYFEVLQWLLNVGLLPECPLSAYPRSDDLDRISAPFPAEILTDFYNHRRALLKILNEENFASSESALFIDTLIEQECGGKILQEQWRNDGGNGLYPPPSLQALLRTYLIDNVDLSYKHSVIIYVFLDLATTLDQDRYKPVITHLIKFPAVFKVSPSVIKLTQAFWQLDHSDYNTAMGLLLDPLIASEDLTQWHHKVVLRALFLQKQHNFALLYLQVRKPVLKDDDDILTAISLYITNNMLDEAFYFVRNFNNESFKTKFLPHLFNECKKNDKLKSIIYRTLSPKEENLFLKYLDESKESSAVDLQVYYHILRSHFIEAFETHERAESIQCDNRGLLGKEQAIPRDKLISCVKKLLPDVNRDLLAFCRKERNNTWLQVSRPTPMSVFVHNANENVQYKSTVIRAALSKAKQTFNDIVDKKVKLNTESTPFLRTPTVATGSKRSSAVIVNPRVIDVTSEETDTSPPSAKKLKLSPRLNSSLSTSVFKFDTPLVKRKTPKAGTEERSVLTPHSILKVKSLANHTTVKKVAEFEDDFKEFEKLDYAPVSETPKKSGLGLSPRRSLAKSSPVVRFEGLRSSSSGTLQNSSLEKSPGPPSRNSSISPIKTDQNLSPKNTSNEDEVFYSPNTSLEEEDGKETTLQQTKGSLELDNIQKHLEVSKQIDKTENIDKEETISPIQSPRGRRSYQRSLTQTTPIRSSPRLSKRISTVENVLESSTSQESTPSSKESSSGSSLEEKSATESVSKSQEPTNDSLKSSPLIPKLRARKSLCRKVLETNALNRVLATPQESPRSRRLKKIQSETVEETTEVVLESSTKYIDGEETQKSSFIKKHNLTTTFEESDSNTSLDLSVGYNEEPVLSDSMLKYINNSYGGNTSENTLSESNKNDNLSPNTSFLEGSNFTQSTPKAANKNNKIVSPEQTYSEGVAIDNSKNFQEKTVKESDSEETVTTNKNLTFGADSIIDKSVAYSVYDTSAEISFAYDPSGPKLSESMLRCINSSDFVEKEVENNESKEDEVMEVDDVEIIEENNKTDEPELTTLSNIQPDEKPAETKEICEENNGSEDKSESCDSEIASSGPIDAHMNVFEISDDLSLNDGMIIEREVTLEEKDLCYGQQNTLEDVLEENIGTVNSIENNTNASYESDQSDDEEEKQQDEENQKSVEVDEVIEIGSSSDDEPRSKQNSSPSESSNSSNDRSFEEKHDVSYERNIYDSDVCYSSDSNCDRHYSEISENSDDVSYNSLQGVDLFQGDIIYEETESKKSEEKEENVETQKETPSDSEDSQQTSEQESDESLQQNKENLEKQEQEMIAINTEENQKNVEEINEQKELQKTIDEEEGVLPEDNSIDMEELSYSVQDDTEKMKDLSAKNNKREKKSDTQISYKNLQLIHKDTSEARKSSEQDVKKVEDILELITAPQSCTQDIKSAERDILDARSAPQSSTQDIKSSERDILAATSAPQSSTQDIKSSERDMLAATSASQSSTQDIKSAERDILDATSAPQSSTQDIKSSERDILAATSAPQSSTQDIKSAEQDILDATSAPQSFTQDIKSAERDILDTTSAPQSSIQDIKSSERDILDAASAPQSSTQDIKSAKQDILDVTSAPQSSTQDIESVERDNSDIKSASQLCSQDTKPIEIDITTKSQDLKQDLKSAKRDILDVTTISQSFDEDRKSIQRDILDMTVLPVSSDQDVKSIEQDILDVTTISERLDQEAKPVEQDIVDVKVEPKLTRTRARSASASSQSRRNNRQKSEDLPEKRVTRSTIDVMEKKDQNLKQSESNIEDEKPSRRITRKALDILEKRNTTPTKLEHDFLDVSVNTPETGRVLRSRRISTEGTPTPTVKLRKRSASVDEANVALKNVEVSKSRGRRAASVLHLPKIPEEENKSKNKSSVLEDYSMNRRITRQQITMLKKLEGTQHNLEQLDPIVLLDRSILEDKRDPEEQKVYDSSPSNSNSSTPVTSRRLRSSSQASETSGRSKSRTPVRSVSSRGRNKSIDEISVDKPSSSKKQGVEVGTLRRGRPRSVSSANSEDSATSDQIKPGRRSKRVASQTPLPEIQEEAEKSEKSILPKKRTRKNSSQI